FYGDDAKPMLVELTTNEAGAVWTAKPCSEPSTEKQAEAKALQQQGLSQRQIAEKLGVGLGSVNRMLKAA
ncbi:MAG: helix-turn-helix domain-containing protein, partial [Proteobacteria bacterium]|nr:helix-turn-helix domain-containing protein [Pseudomonadota bacterium]